MAFLHEDASPWVLGIVANNIWSFGGRLRQQQQNEPDAAQSDHRLSFGGRMGAELLAEITANWIANGNKWTVPVGGA